jgi:plasmid stabilization system protein ParE
MNGLTGTRRLARPVRLALARQLGADIDGAWWPHTGSLARELPELIGVLNTPLGEIVDICINWSVTEAPRELYELASSARSLADAQRKHQRLMVVEGRTASAKLLVVPHMTSQALGVMVMRRAAARSISVAERDTHLFGIADSVMRAAATESARWTRQLKTAVVAENPAAHPDSGSGLAEEG